MTVPNTKQEFPAGSRRQSGVEVVVIEAKKEEGYESKDLDIELLQVKDLMEVKDETQQ